MITLTEQKQNAALPEDTAETLRRVRDESTTEFYAYVLALRARRWPLRALGDVFGVTRVAAKAWETRAKQNSEAQKLSEDLEVPSLPFNARGNGVKPKKIVPDVPQHDREYIRELANKAKDVRRWTPEDSEAREAAKTLEKLLYTYAYEKNVPVTRLAEHAGVSRRAVAQRLAKQIKIVS
jgi:hypothetical protein